MPWLVQGQATSDFLNIQGESDPYTNKLFLCGYHIHQIHIYQPQKAEEVGDIEEVSEPDKSSDLEEISFESWKRTRRPTTRLQLSENPFWSQTLLSNLRKIQKSSYQDLKFFIKDVENLWISKIVILNATDVEPLLGEVLRDACSEND